MFLFAPSSKQFSERPAKKLRKNVTTQTQNHAGKYAVFAVAQIQKNPDRVCVRKHSILWNTNTLNSMSSVFKSLFTLGVEDLNTTQWGPRLLQSNTSQMHPKPPVFGIGVFMHISASLSLPPHTSRQSHEANTKARRPSRCVNTAQRVRNRSRALLLWTIIVVEFEKIAWRRGNCYMTIRKKKKERKKKKKLFIFSKPDGVKVKPEQPV